MKGWKKMQRTARFVRSPRLPGSAETLPQSTEAELSYGQSCRSWSRTASCSNPPGPTPIMPLAFQVTIPSWDPHFLRYFHGITVDYILSFAVKESFNHPLSPCKSRTSETFRKVVAGMVHWLLRMRQHFRTAESPRSLTVPPRAFCV